MIGAARRPPPRAWLPPVLAGALLLAGIGAVILLARRSGGTDLPPEPPPFATPAPARPTVALDVQQVAGGRLTLSDGSRDVVPRADARVERLRAVSAAEVRPGDWLTVVGIPNEVRNFSIRSLVLIASPAPPDADGVRRSAAGFAGHEASRDGSERPLLGGTVERVEGERVLLAAAAGPVTVTLAPNAPLYRLEAADAGSVREGDRIAVAGGASPDTATAVLILPGGAR